MTAGVSYMLLSAMLPISKYVWLMFYLFFKVSILFCFDFF
jgi:hypothetical protein